jgi:hypothetical protein
MTPAFVTSSSLLVGLTKRLPNPKLAQLRNPEHRELLRSGLLLAMGETGVTAAAGRPENLLPRRGSPGL